MAMHTAETPHCLDTATYEKPVDIRVTENRGRGLFSMKDIAAGDLLLCEKAFSYSFLENPSTTSLANENAFKGSNRALLTSTIHQLLRNPSFYPTLASLYHGTYKPAKEKVVDGMPVIDTFLIDGIISFNVFECTRDSILLHAHEVGLSNAKQGKRDRVCGLFIEASHVNHSCYFNTGRSLIGDVLILRATRSIPAGQEISFWYALHKADHSYEKMQGKLQDWDFKCTCEICIHDLETPNKMKNERCALLEEWDVAAKSIESEDNLANMERLLAAIKQTYTVSAAVAPRLALLNPYLTLTRVYAPLEQPAKSIITAWKVLKALGFVVKRVTSSVTSPFEIELWGPVADPLIETWWRLWLPYRCLTLRQPALGTKAEYYARVT